MHREYITERQVAISYSDLHGLRMGTPLVVASAPLAAAVSLQVPVEAPLARRAASDAGLPGPTASPRCSRPGKSLGSALSETGMSPKTSRIARRGNFRSAAPGWQALLPALRSPLAGGPFTRATRSRNCASALSAVCRDTGLAAVATDRVSPAWVTVQRSCRDASISPSASRALANARPVPGGSLAALSRASSPHTKPRKRRRVWRTSSVG